MKRIVLSLLLVLLVACSAPAEPTPTPVPPTPTPSPQDWLDEAVGAWNTTDSFHFTLALENRSLELAAGAQTDEAEGDVLAPDRVQVTTLIRTLLGSTEVQFIAIGDDQWLTNPLNGRWEQAPPELQTDVTGIFDREAGIGALLADMQNLERLANEEVEGTQTIHLHGTLPGAALTTFAADLEPTDEVTVDLWMAQDDRRLRRIIITEPANAQGETPTWTFIFTNFDAALTIEPPL